MVKKINLNHMARAITLKEGGKVSLSIGQVKEVLKLTLQALALEDEEQVIKTIKRYKPKRGRCFFA